MQVNRVLALALARHLDALTRPDLRVLSWASKDAILLASPDGALGVLVQSEFDRGDPAGFAERALWEVQEYMIEWVVKGGWPPIDPMRPRDPQSGARLPYPGAALDGDELTLWYGERGRPSLALPSISEDDLSSLEREAERGDDDLIAAQWSRIVEIFARAEVASLAWASVRECPPSGRRKPG
jgi:hypothetical protein